MAETTKTISISKERNFLVKVCDFVISGTIALIFLLVPLFFTGLVAQGIIFEKAILFYLLLLLGLVAWTTKGIVAGELKLKRTPLDLPLIVLAVIFLVSSIMSVDRTASIIGSFGAVTKSLLALVAYIAFYYLLINNTTLKRIKLFVWMLLVGIVIVVAYSLLQLYDIFILPFDFTKVNSFNTIGSISSLGIYVASILPLLSILIPYLAKAKEEKVFKKIMAIGLRGLVGAVGLGALYILFILNNFIYWPIAILGMVIILMFVLSKILELRQSDLILPIGVFLLLIIFLVGGNFGLINIQLPTEVSISRELSWQISRDSLRSDPFLGSGPATFDYAFAKYRGIDFNISNLWSIRFSTASGALFEMLASIGILGTFAFLVIGLILVSVTFIALIRSEDKKIKAILLGIFASLFVLVINSLLFTVSGTIILLIIILSSFTMALIIAEEPEKFKEITLSFRASPKYALALSSLFLLISAGVVVLFTLGFKMYLADYYARQVGTRTDLGRAVQDLNKSILMADYQDRYYLQISQYYMALANQEAMKGANAEQALIEQNLSSAINSGKQAVELSPNSVANNESLALIYENAALYIRGALEWAEKYYIKVTELEPDSPSAYVRLALIKVAQANREESDSEKRYYYNEAIKFYEKAIAKKSNLAPAHYGIAIVRERLGDFDKAIEQVGQAVVLAGNNLDYRFELGRLYFNRGVASQNLQQQQTKQITSSENKKEALYEKELSVEEGAVSPGKTVENDDLKTAKAIFENILQASSNHANATYSLAMIHEVLGEQEQAKEYYEKLLDIITDQATKDAVLEKLKSL